LATAPLRVSFRRTKHSAKPGILVKQWRLE